MSVLTKEQIFAVPQQLQEVEVPEWGGSVFIRPITLQEQAKLADLGIQFEKASVAIRMKKVTMQFILWAIVDADGNPLFSAEDLELMLTKSSKPFLRLQDQILKFSGLTEEARAELAKNSGTVLTGNFDS